MSEDNKPVSEHSLSKLEKNAKVVIVKSCQCYFKIEALELIFIDEGSAKEFEDVITKLSDIINIHHEAKISYSSAIEKYGQAKKDIANQDRLQEYEKDITEKESALKTATQNLQQELGEFDEETGYKAVIEMIPIEPLKIRAFGNFYSYIKKSDYEKFKDKLIVVSVDDLKGDAIFIKDDNKNITGINIDALKEKLSSVKDILKQMMDPTMTISGDINYEATLTEWADAWNSQYNDYKKEGQYIDVSAGAQFLRMTANASTLNTWNPKTGQVQIKGEAKADLTLFAGKVESTLYVPDRVGWPLKFMVNDKKEANLGILRAKIISELTGYVGASAQVEANLQFVTYKQKQLLMGNRTESSTFQNRKQGVKVKGGDDKPSKGLEVKAEAFGGAKVGGAIGGALQWLKPFDSLVDELPGMLKAFGLDSGSFLDQDILKQIMQGNKDAENKKESHLGEFQDFGTFKLGGEVQLGLGASGEFRVRFVKGKFRFHIHGSLCLGPGAKGNVEGEITPELFKEFAIWVIYQLYGIDYKHWVIIEEEAFKALSYMLVMGGENIYKKYFSKASAEVKDVLQQFNLFMGKVASDVLDARAKSIARNDYADSINSDPGKVYFFTPEAKGVALFLLIGDGAYDRVDINNQGDGILPDTNKNRKKAVLFILSSIQTKREWKKVLNRITSNGTAYSADEEANVKKSQENLKIFLQIGFNRDQELEELIDKLELRDLKEVEKRLKSRPAYGYPFAPNCSKQYAVNCYDNPFYSSLCHFEPVYPQYQQKWEGNE